MTVAALRRIGRPWAAVGLLGLALLAGRSAAVSVGDPVEVEIWVKVLPAATLKANLVVSATAVSTGQDVLLTLTVTNTGTAQATNLLARLWKASGKGAATLNGPNPSLVPSLGAGAAVTFSWTATASTAGTIVWSGTSTADGPVSSNALTSPVVIIQIPEARIARVRKFEKPVVAYPNPVRGDRFNVVVNLETDAAEVVVEVYNTAYERVFRGVWRHVADSENLVISGVSRWGPGLYLLRVKARLVNGKEPKFPLGKVVIRR